MEGKGLVQGTEIVKAVPPRRSDVQAKVDLAMGTDVRRHPLDCNEIGPAPISGRHGRT